MLLSSIQIQGFKSFADKTTLKFGKGITGIVGPNGSGKSNISDAVRWVLGEQSTKSLRGQSMEDVIFGGTATRRPHGFCEVTLNIDNTDRSLNFDEDFVSVTRRYYRSHESEYMINGASVRLKDINELFMDTGLGRDGYSMVGQGKIDAIISTKSNERRDIFEEASGISKYRYRKTEAQRKLALADDNLLRLKDIMTELEDRVGPLKIQSEKAEKFLELAGQKKNLEIGLWLKKLNDFKDALRAHENKMTVCEVRYNEIEDSLSEFDAVTQENSGLFTEYTAAIEEKRQGISSGNEQTAVFAGNISVLENDIAHNNETLQRVSTEKESLIAGSEQSKLEIERNLEEADKILAEIGALNESLSERENELNRLLTDSEGFSRQIEQLNAELNGLSVAAADLKVTVLSSNAAVAEIDERSQVLGDLILKQRQTAGQLQKEYDETKAFLDKTVKAKEESENALKGYEMRYAAKKADGDAIKTELDDIRLDIQAKQRRVQILEDLEKNMEGFNYSVKQVMSGSKTGTLRGVTGPVAGIINVDKKFAVAVETALGPALQHIVVENDADAKRAIEMLKNSNAGRATFLPVASIKPRPFTEKGFEDMFGYVGIASDIVKCDEKYRDIIKYLLGAVVITEDIDSAVTVSRKFNYHFKVVSLDGQVINAGGSMTGGSLIKNAGLLSRREDIKRIKSDIEKLCGKEKTVGDRYDKALNDISKANADIVTATDLLKTASEDEIRTASELHRIEELQQNADTLIKQYTQESEAGEVRKNQLLSTAKTAQDELDDNEKCVAQIQEKIEANQGGRQSLAQSREEVIADITEIKLAASSKQKDRENLLLLAKQIENSLENRDEKIEQLSAEYNEIVEQNAKKQQDIDSVKAAIDGIKQAAEVYEKEIETLTQKRNEIEKKNTEMRTLEKEKTLEREKISGELARLTERKENMLADYDNVIKQLYDEYNLTRSEAESLGIEIKDVSAAKKQLSEIKSGIKALGNVNVAAIEEYREVNERYTFMSEQIADVQQSRAELSKLINQLTSQMQEMFTSGFARINECFSKTFTELFGGGSASLVLTDPENVLESGIDINAKLPGKNVPSLDGLSGGEKALVALSIYFAIMFVNAPPFCFLDEVDTALDDINVERFARYMKNSGFATQFICVTHRRGTMEAADMLYGVTMQEKGVTKLLELNVAELEKKIAEGEI